MRSLFRVAPSTRTALKQRLAPPRPKAAVMATAAVAAPPPLGKIAADPRGAAPIAPVRPDPFGAGADAAATAAIDRINEAYNGLHLEFERHFWGTKMALPDSTTQQLSDAKTAYEAFLADAKNLATVDALLDGAGAPPLTEPQRRVLEVMRRTFRTYASAGPEADALKARLNELEADLSSRRNGMALGMVRPAPSAAAAAAATKDGGGGGGAAAGEFVAMSSVQLRNAMRVSEDEAERRAAYEGLCAIGPFVAEGLCEIVKLRNRLARAQGHGDYYEYKVQAAEQMSKARLFEILDGLERRTLPIAERARARLAAEKGAAALEPWNLSQALAGDATRALDRYFPFENAVDVWARSFAALGITYSGGEMALDLLDRPGKYSNGFCAWPQPSYRRAGGSFVPARANFTSLATPSAVGSGFTALTTLLHEGGHAAHFAGVDQESPLCAQERPPFSVALAETQSMTLDAFGEDAGWLARYAVSRDGEVVPWSLVEDNLRATQPYAVFALRAMLAVSYFEKALYELSEDEVTPQRLVALADAVERRVQGGLSPRPLLSVPHILADEASAYYHGYTLASCAVHQNRAAFRAMLGTHDLADRPEVGAWLAAGYWRCGNTRGFLPLVEDLTGRPLSADAWVEELEADVEAVVAREKGDYEAAVAGGGAKYKTGDAAVEAALKMRVRLVHGAETISDSAVDGGLGGACDKFAKWVREKYF